MVVNDDGIDFTATVWVAVDREGVIHGAAREAEDAIRGVSRVVDGPISVVRMTGPSRVLAQMVDRGSHGRVAFTGE